MNVQVKKGSAAENYYRSQAGLPGGKAMLPAEIAPGVHSSPAHDLVFRGGKTVPDMTYTNFFIGGKQSWIPQDVTRIDEALAVALTDPDLNNVMAQYFEQPINCTFRPSNILSGPRPLIVSQGDVEEFVRNLRAQGQLNGFPLSSTIFNIMLPRGTILNTNTGPTNGAAVLSVVERASDPLLPEIDASSLGGLGGYHGSIHVKPQNAPRETIYYSVGVFSEIRNDGSENGIAVFDQSWKNIVATFYHELSEFRTDPDVEDAIKAGNDPAAESFLGWMSQQGEEVGDFPIAAANPLTEVFKEVEVGSIGKRVPVQFQYSNAVHGPEGPIDTPH
jgi:hypothetical protein